MSGILSNLEPKTNAFGAVATGNINAQDAATVVETISVYGLIFKDRAIGAITGNSIAVVARFEVISVKKLTIEIIKKITMKRGRVSINVIWLPIQSARPVVLNPFAMANPPPNNKSIPQGSFTASSQEINF